MHSYLYHIIINFIISWLMWHSGQVAFGTCNQRKHEFIYKFKGCLFESDVCILHDYQNPKFLVGAPPELLFNQFVRILWINILFPFLRVDSVRIRNRQLIKIAIARFFPIGETHVVPLNIQTAWHSIHSVKLRSTCLGFT